MPRLRKRETGIEAGVGTIASGVAKAKADVVLIAGFDGGTGASPMSSIRHTGLPWELGLAKRINIEERYSPYRGSADGQMKTPRDLAVATLPGAEECGNSSIVVEGCIMMRKCHRTPVLSVSRLKTRRFASALMVA